MKQRLTSSCVFPRFVSAKPHDALGCLLTGLTAGWPPNAALAAWFQLFLLAVVATHQINNLISVASLLCLKR